MKKSMDKNKPSMQQAERPVILLLDDEEPIVQALAMFLEDLNYEVCTFTSPRRALEHVKTCLPNLIITDLMMPGMNGNEFIQQVRHDLHLKMPIIMMSAARQPGHMGLADAYLPKPFDLSVLEQLIARFLPPQRMPHHDDSQSSHLTA